MNSKKVVYVILFVAVFILNPFGFNSYAKDAKNSATVTKEENKVISLNKAKLEFLKYGQPRLMYVRPWNLENAKDNRKLKLIYSLVNGPYYYIDFKAIDAITGIPINAWGKKFKFYNEKIGEDSNIIVNSKVGNLQEPLKENEAKLIALGLASKYNISLDGNLNYVPDFDDNWSGLSQGVYTFSWSSKGISKNFLFSVTVDMLTGKVLEIRYINDKTNSNTKAKLGNNISWEDGKTKAVDFLKKVFPEYLGSLVLMQSNPYSNDKTSGNDYYYSFWRSVNGILYPENNVNVKIDSSTGEVIEYGYRWENIDFPAVGASLLSEDAAAEIFMDKVGLKLVNRSYYGNQKQNELIYNGLDYEANISNAAYIDAYSGKLKDSKGQEVVTGN